MISEEKLRAHLDALPRPIALSGYIQVFTIDPATGKAAWGEDAHWVTSGSPEDALVMLKYMLEEEPR